MGGGGGDGIVSFWGSPRRIDGETFSSYGALKEYAEAENETGSGGVAVVAVEAVEEWGDGTTGNVT